MKPVQFVRFWDGEGVHFGAVEGEQVRLLRGSIFGDYAPTGRTCELKEVARLAPCEPSKVVCVGLNYRDHALEFDLPLPEEPVLFLKPPSAVIGHDQEIARPSVCRRLDFEGELAVVMGSIARFVEPSEAMACVLGYTCANDVTARDLQPKHGQWTLAKSFDTFCPLGPVIATGIDPSDLELTVRVNGNVRQHSRTSQMVFDVPRLVSFISRVMTLFPGDVILTGTPAGIGRLEPGDLLEVSIEGIGALSNRVVEGR